MNNPEVNNNISSEIQGDRGSTDIPDQTVPVIEVQSSPERADTYVNSTPLQGSNIASNQRTPVQSPLETSSKSSQHKTPIQSPVSPTVHTPIPSAPDTAIPTAIPAENPNQSGFNLPTISTLATPQVMETISSISSWGSSLFSSFSQKSKEVAKKFQSDVKETEKELKKTFEEEPKKFEKPQYEVIKRLPWDNPRLGILQEECKEMIIKLSEKENTFFDFPPDGEYKEFSLQQMEYLAPKLCEIDKNLAKMSVKLIRRKKSYLDKAERWLGKTDKSSNNYQPITSPLEQVKKSPRITETTTVTAATATANATTVTPLLKQTDTIIPNTAPTTTIPTTISSQQQQQQQQPSSLVTETTVKTTTPKFVSTLLDGDTNPSTATTTDDLDISALAAQLTFEDEIMPDDDEIDNLIRDELG